MTVASKDLEGWFKRTERKGPFYLYKRQKFDPKHPHRERYWLFWTEKNKTKFGTLEDGHHARYGFRTIATLTGTSVTGLWQSRANTINQYELEKMQLVAEGHFHHMTQFDIRTIRDLEW